jgi:hypothetical protein
MKTYRIALLLLLAGQAFAQYNAFNGQCATASVFAVYPVLTLLSL